MDASEQSVFSKVLDKWLQIRLSSYRISLYLVKEAGKWYVDPESIMNYDMSSAKWGAKYSLTYRPHGSCLCP